MAIARTYGPFEGVQNGGTAGSWNVTGVQYGSGDLVLVGVAAACSHSYDLGTLTASGGTGLGTWSSAEALTASSDGSLKTCWFWAVASSSQSSQTITISHSGTSTGFWCWAVVQAFSGCNTSSPVGATGTGGNNSSQPASVTVDFSGTGRTGSYVAMVGFDYNDNSSTLGSLDGNSTEIENDGSGATDAWAQRRTNLVDAGSYTLTRAFDVADYWRASGIEIKAGAQTVEKTSTATALVQDTISKTSTGTVLIENAGEKQSTATALVASTVEKTATADVLIDPPTISTPVWGAVVTGNGAASLSVPYPSSPTTDDVFLLFAYSRANVASAFSQPSGWSTLKASTATANGSYAVYYKQSAGTESGNLTLTANASNNTELARMCRIRYASTTFTEGSAETEAAGSTVTNSGVTPGSPRSMVFLFTGKGDGGASTTDDYSGWTGNSLTWAGVANGTTSGTDGAIGIGYATKADTAATSNLEVSCTLTFVGISYSFSVKPATNTIGKASTATVLVADANTITASSTATALVQGTIEKTATATALVQETLAKTSNATALVAATTTKDSTATALIQATLEKTSTATALIIGVTEKTSTATALVQATLEQSSSAQALVAATTEKTATATALVQATLEKTATATALVQATLEKTATATALVAAVTEKSSTATTLIQGTVEASATGTALVAAVTEKTATATALVQATVEASSTAEALIVGTAEQSSSATVLVQGEVEHTSTATALVSDGVGTVEASSTATALVQGEVEASSTATALVQETLEQSSTAYVRVKGIVTKTATAEALVAATGSKTSQATAYIGARKTKTTTATVMVSGTAERVTTATVLVDDGTLPGVESACARVRVWDGSNWV